MTTTGGVPNQHWRQLLARWRVPVWVLVIPVLLLAAWLGLHGLDRDLIWLDEFLTRKFTIGMTGEPQPFIMAVGNAVRDGVWPPLYLLLYYGWMLPTGWSLFVGRFLSLIFGLITVASMYRLGKTFHSPAAGVFAAFIAATSAFIGYYNHEMRGYSMYALAVTLTLWTYWRLVVARRSYRALPRPIRRQFQLGLLLLLYSHYVAAALFVVLGLYHLLFYPRDWSIRRVFNRGKARAASLFEGRSPNFRWILGRFFMIFLLYTPWVLVMLAGILYEAQPTSIRSIGIERVISSSFYGFTNGMPLLAVFVFGYLLLFLRRRVVFYLVFIGSITLGIAFLMDTKISYLLHIRHILFLPVIGTILLALVIADLWRRFAPAALVVLAVWAVPGIALSLNNEFMNSIPGQVKSIPVSLEHSFIELQQSCTAPDHALIISVDQPREFGEWAQIDSLQMSLPAYDFSAALLGYMIPMQENIYKYPIDDGTYAERFERIIGDAPTTWVLTLNERPMSAWTPQFESLMREKYAYCGVYGQRAETTIYAYHNSSTLTCGRVTVELPPCAVDLISGS